MPHQKNIEKLPGYMAITQWFSIKDHQASQSNFEKINLKERTIRKSTFKTPPISIAKKKHSTSLLFSHLFRC
jgi:hypothetical protein